MSQTFHVSILSVADGTISVSLVESILLAGLDAYIIYQPHEVFTHFVNRPSLAYLASTIDFWSLEYTPDLTDSTDLAFNDLLAALPIDRALLVCPELITGTARVAAEVPFIAMILITTFRQVSAAGFVSSTVRLCISSHRKANSAAQRLKQLRHSAPFSIYHAGDYPHLTSQVSHQRIRQSNNIQILATTQPDMLYNSSNYLFIDCCNITTPNPQLLSSPIP